MHIVYLFMTCLVLNTIYANTLYDQTTKVEDDQLYTVRFRNGDTLYTAKSLFDVNYVTAACSLIPNEQGVYDLRPLQRAQQRAARQNMPWFARHRGKMGFLIGMAFGASVISTAQAKGVFASSAWGWMVNKI